jgi:hypothetical protein
MLLELMPLLLMWRRIAELDHEYRREGDGNEDEDEDATGRSSTRQEESKPAPPFYMTSI